MLQCNIEFPAVMYLIPLGWMYVAVLMAVAEATHPRGTVLGAVITFVLYGVLPVALLLYFIGRRSRRHRSAAPDAGGQPAADPVPPVRKEP